MTAQLVIGRASAAFVQRGHPWVRVDRWTRGLAGLRPGQRVQLCDEHGRRLAEALADPESPICARVVPEHWDAVSAARAAWQRRAPLHRDPQTDCYRLVHGEADALPGLRVDRYGACLIATVSAGCIQPYLDAVLGALAELASPDLVVVHEQLADLRCAPVRSWRWPERVAVPEVQREGRELGVSFLLRPAGGLNPGLYVDQRATRAWLRQRARGARVLNLFAFTGAFSVSLLCAGAAAATDVDIAASALQRAADNAERNGVGARHRALRSDARTFCARSLERYDLVIIDPPTAAQGERSWVARRDYPELLRLAWRLLEPGGLLLAVSNTQGRPLPLADLVSQSCPGAQRLAGPELAEDVPLLPGFPEGRPYRLVAVRRPDAAVAPPASCAP
ncbi:MAG: class I SAM-dependent methyltransferase [Planctomycetota bacterium]|nr:class I SAM-dependent methyltransferase [Planctomycetota bacterium]MDW8373070.1 class I SAM-dependent methyltransferase [Planctomycetota bacterium]